MITTLLHLFRLFPFLCGGHRQLALVSARVSIWIRLVCTNRYAVNAVAREVASRGV
jgi:hypothetical protein